MRWNRLLPVIGVGILMATAGCSPRNQFKVEVTVQHCTYSEPLDGVKVVIDTLGNTAERTNPDYGVEIGRTTASGRVEYLLEVPSSHEPNDQRRWLLKASREGFLTEVMDVSPKEWPKTSGQVMPLIMLVKLKPKPAAAGSK
jgi:hypothetical protein